MGVEEIRDELVDAEAVGLVSPLTGTEPNVFTLPAAATAGAGTGDDDMGAGASRIVPKVTPDPVAHDDEFLATGAEFRQKSRTLF